MAREHVPSDDPREWIEHAQSNLVLAGTVAPGVKLESLCFEAQQVAEKAIKAVFVLGGEPFPYIHDLKKLLIRLEKNGHKIPKFVWEADELSPFAVEARYPGMAEPVTRREYRRAIRIAEAVLRWAERQVAAAAKKREGKK